ncbi:hypothetical protein K474DRAFT_1077720 [Panus rudis PR-1116 ss-1]|nr:hypothetical protein K474DRAFT_1077720 [Panus rudis PR-1116 ss-1]
MKMCQQHWLSLDQKALSQYAVPEDAKHKPTTEEQSTGASSNKLFKIKQVQPKRIAGSQNVQGLIPVETTKRPQSPFENHTVIVTTLKKACEMEGWPTKRDRTTVDQLADLDGRIVKVIRSTRALRLTSVRNSVASSTNPSGRLANVGGKSGSNKRSSKSGNRDRGSTSRAQTESRGGSHKRNASTRAGSKRKATCEPLLEDTAEPELAEGTSTDVAGDSEVSARSRNSKRSRLQ